MASSSSFLCIILLLLLTLTHGIDVNKKIKINNNNIVTEEGYTVSTIIDGDKLNINPYSVISLYGSSSSDIVILDSVKSTFYTASFSGSEVSEVKKLSGNGDAGYKDGELASATFNKPKSFAIDRKNNIYIADKANHVIRKISKSGVTTIAGGNVQKTGKADGPAQNASFSDDFELAFDPQRCALLISDHGNRLVRQLDLKAEDCAYSSSGGSALGSTIAWGIGVGVACIVGLIVGFVIRPYVLPHEASGRHQVSLTWKHCLISLGKQAATFYFVIRSAIASHNIYHFFEKLLRLSFSQLSLVFGINMLSRPPPAPLKPMSLLDCDDLQPSTPVKPSSFLDYGNLGHTETTKTHDLVDELKDLITYECTSNTKLTLNQENAYRVEEKNEVLSETGGKLDRHIYANFAGFVESSKRTSSVDSWGIGS